MRRRQIIKWLHWLSLAFLIYFFLVEPEDVRDLGAAAVATHAGAGMLYGVIVLAWFAIYLKNGLTGRAGPKLPPLARRVYPIAHKGLYWGSVAMMISGGLIGVFAPYVIMGFGVVPILPNIGAKALHDVMQEAHELIFNLLWIMIAVHAAFHLWRHFLLKDNALRIMVPKPLHRFL